MAARIYLPETAWQQITVFSHYRKSHSQTFCHDGLDGRALQGGYVMKIDEKIPHPRPFPWRRKPNASPGEGRKPGCIFIIGGGPRDMMSFVKIAVMLHHPGPLRVLTTKTKGVVRRGEKTGWHFHAGRWKHHHEDLPEKVLRDNFWKPQMGFAK